MAARRSPTFELLDYLLAADGGLETFVRGLRAQGVSWRRVARILEDRTGRDLTFETLRGWFPSENGEGEAA